ncbi:MAG: MotA/TolQ/ExbB proton channel family protein [Planctomycetota bacterium]
MNRPYTAAVAAVLLALFCADTSLAATAEPAPTDPISVILSGGVTAIVIMVVLVLVSIAAVALCVEHLLTIRQSELLPAGLADEVRRLLTSGDAAAANKACQAESSTLGAVVSSGLVESQYGWAAVEQAMQEKLDEESARLMRRIEYLSVIGNIAPMIGLLGTVFGMIFAFQEVANTQGAARAGELAGGIYQALVTTVGGLIVAIPSLAAFAVFRNRVDGLIAETACQARHATTPLKQVLSKRTAKGPP